MRGHRSQIWMRAAVVALVLVFVTGSGTWFLLPALGCALVVQVMMGGRGAGSGASDRR